MKVASAPCMCGCHAAPAPKLSHGDVILNLMSSMRALLVCILGEQGLRPRVATTTACTSLLRARGSQTTQRLT